MGLLETKSHVNEDLLLDVPFSPEEVSGVVAKLKGRKAPGPDGLMAEQLKGGGTVRSPTVKSRDFYLQMTSFQSRSTR